MFIGVDIMKFNTKKITAAFLAGMLGFGIAGVSLPSASEAAQQARFEDGTSNEYSHRMQEEERTHKQNVRYCRYQLKKGEISEKEYNKKMKEEQNRHDRELKKIKADYENRSHHRNK